MDPSYPICPSSGSKRRRLDDDHIDLTAQCFGQHTQQNKQPWAAFGCQNFHWSRATAHQAVLAASSYPDPKPHSTEEDAPQSANLALGSVDANIQVGHATPPSLGLWDIDASQSSSSWLTIELAASTGLSSCSSQLGPGPQGLDYWGGSQQPSSLLPQHSQWHPTIPQTNLAFQYERVTPTATSLLPRAIHAPAISESTFNEIPETAIELPKQPVDENETVCFGVISAVSGHCERADYRDLPLPFPAEITSSDCFHASSDPQVRGRIRSEHGQMLQGLLDEGSLSLRASCTINSQSPRGKSDRVGVQSPCSIAITIYGPREMFNDVGDFFQSYDVYLQDPLVCHMDVRYCNPHRLSSDDLASCPLLSALVTQTPAMFRLQDGAGAPDLLLSDHSSLAEAATPTAIRTILKRHQKQALTFMHQRERGWSFSGAPPDIWEIANTESGPYFLNRISKACHSGEPEEFCGGIIADPMGLGKTLTMISLVASDRDLDGCPGSLLETDHERVQPIAATLVIVPPPLLDTWEQELEKHVIHNGLVCRRHHGKSRLSVLNELVGVNVVLTTYHTVSAEWRPTQDLLGSVLFSVCWRRIILDEAHFIRNGTSRMAGAVCALNSVSRWAVTGTPVQNRLTDLASLLKFIRAYPYTDMREFEVDITRPWKSGEDEETKRRLAILSSCLLLRRPTSTVSLPTRNDMLCPVDFTPSERELYANAREQAIKKIDEALLQSSELSRVGGYVNALQKIESLRLICDLGLHYHTRHNRGATTASESSRDWISEVAQHAFNAERERGQTTCLQCSENLELMQGGLENHNDLDETAQFFRCLKYICTDCTTRLRNMRRTLGCGHRPSCSVAEVSTSSAAMEDTPDMILMQPGMPGVSLPSKVEALIDDIRGLPTNTKCVVFSTWRLTLALVEKGLQQASIRTVRFDGKVNQKDRNSAVEQFKTDKDTRVMLLTLSCGAVGLTLTVASRAYLMEPHWNPTLEEQALARIHRIGQTREVTTVRFFIRDSFEEEVMKLQKKKRQLAGVLLSPHDGSQGEDSLGRLHELRRLL